MKQLPNILTFIRIGSLPVLIYLLYLSDAWAVWTALGLYIFAAITDFLDGYLARKMNIVSDLGTFLDPIADKIFIASLLIAFAALGRLEGLWIIPAIMILVREFFISGLREFLGPKDIKVPVSKLAKWKTTIQMVALGFLVIAGDFLFIGQVTLALAAALTVITGWSYLKAGAEHIK